MSQQQQATKSDYFNTFGCAYLVPSRTYEMLSCWREFSHAFFFQCQSFDVTEHNCRKRNWVHWSPKHPSCLRKLIGSKGKGGKRSYSGATGDFGCLRMLAEVSWHDSNPAVAEVTLTLSILQGGAGITGSSGCRQNPENYCCILVSQQETVAISIGMVGNNCWYRLHQRLQEMVCFCKTMPCFPFDSGREHCPLVMGNPPKCASKSTWGQNGYSQD